MRRLDRVDAAFFVLWLLDAAFIFWAVQGLSISVYEARIYWGESSIASFLAHLFVPFWGENNLGLKFPFLLLHLFNLFLFYEVSRHTLKRPFDAFLSVALFALLPGVNASALLIGESGIIMSMALLICYIHLKYKVIPYPLLALAILIDSGMAILFLALFFYAIKERQNRLLLFSLIAFTVSMYLWGIDVGGKPKGHFLDTLGIFATLFSPLLFLYFVYALYRILIKEEKPLLWYISFSALMFTLLLSFRQKVNIEEYAPLVLIGLPLVVKVFLSGLRVRLPRFRRSYQLWFYIAVVTLGINSLGLVFNKLFYRVIENPREHFAYRFHIANELALALKEKGIREVKIKDEAMRLRLACYGIGSSEALELKEGRGKRAILEIPIRYFGYEVERYHVQKR